MVVTVLYPLFYGHQHLNSKYLREWIAFSAYKKGETSGRR